MVLSEGEEEWQEEEEEEEKEEGSESYKLGLTANLVVRLISLLLVEGSEMGLHYSNSTAERRQNWKVAFNESYEFLCG